MKGTRTRTRNLRLLNQKHRWESGRPRLSHRSQYESGQTRKARVSCCLPFPKSCSLFAARRTPSRGGVRAGDGEYTAHKISSCQLVTPSSCLTSICCLLASKIHPYLGHNIIRELMPAVKQLQVCTSSIACEGEGCSNVKTKQKKPSFRLARLLLFPQLNVASCHPRTHQRVPMHKEWLREIRLDSDDLNNSISTPMKPSTVRTETYLVMDIVVVRIIPCHQLEWVVREVISTMIVYGLESREAE